MFMHYLKMIIWRINLLKNESIFNSFITVEKVKKEELGYIFRFESRGFITGMQTFLLDPTDPFPAGFLLK